MSQRSLFDDALRLHCARQLEAAERGYLSVLEDEPNNTAVVHLLGVIRQQQGRHEEALELIGRAIAANPAKAVYHNNYGAALLSLERFTEAEASFHRALAIRADYADALANLGMAQAALSNDPAAEASLRRALQSHPWHRDAVARLAGLLQRQDRLAESGQLLTAALAAAPCPQFHLALGNLRLAEGQAQKAVEHFHAALITGVTLRAEADGDASNRRVYDGTWLGDMGSRCVSEEVTKTPSLARRARIGADTRRIAFVSPHCVLDFTNGAATATLDALKLLSGIGFPCEVFCGTRVDSMGSVTAALARPRPNPLPAGEGNLHHAERDEYRVGPFRGRMIFTAHGGVPVTLVDTGPARDETINREAMAAFLTGCEVFLDATRPDVLWTYGGDPAALVVQHMAAQRGIPILFALHTCAYKDKGPFQMVDRVIVPSEYARRHYRETLGLECDVLPLVVDLERVKVAGTVPVPSAKNGTRSLPDTLADGTRSVPATFVTFVNPTPLKGVFVFARIAQELSARRPDIPLLIVEGSGKACFLPKLGIDLSGVKNLRIMPNTPDARQFLAATKLLLMPSLMESAGLVAMEAMTNGIPVLASNRGALPETIGNEGFLFDIPACYTPETRDPPTAEEVEPWVETIIRLWDDPAEYARRSQAARERAQAWHPDRLAPIYREFFGRVIPWPGFVPRPCP
jgi:glycosyltransferase involved in cell wall biosynthesis/Tfp pilus assembly protein PilF